MRLTLLVVFVCEKVFKNRYRLILWDDGKCQNETIFEGMMEYYIVRKC